MAKIKIVPIVNDRVQYHYFCMGCGYTHCFELKSAGGHHDFNMDLDNPTVSPSLLQNFGGGSKLCHSFIRNGKIQYLNDCQHSYAGYAIELPEIK